MPSEVRFKESKPPTEGCPFVCRSRTPSVVCLKQYETKARAMVCLPYWIESDVRLVEFISLR